MKKALDENILLKEIIPGHIWVQHAPLRFFGVEVGSRMTVVQLRNNQLFVHSPLQLNDVIAAQLDNIGRVSYIVSPNNLHHLFIGDYFDHYKHAKFYASPGLTAKRKDIKFTAELKNEPDPDWAESLDQMIFFGHESFQEVVFYHRFSKTLIVADLLMNFTERASSLTKLVTRLMGIYGQPTLPLDFKHSSLQALRFQMSVKKLMEWDFQRIILAHGDIIPQNGKEVLRQAFEGLNETNN